MTRKDDRIQALEAELEKQRNLTETLRHSIKNSAEIDKARADFHRKEKERAEEQAKLKNIREGLIPVDEIRGLIRNVHHEHNGLAGYARTHIELSIAGPRTEIEKAVLHALTAEKPNYAAGGFVSLSQADRENFVRAANLYPEVRNSSFDNLGRVL